MKITDRGKHTVAMHPRQSKKTGEAPQKNRPPITFTNDQIEKLFHLDLNTAATNLGISASSLKIVCRMLGINRWPYTKKGKSNPQKIVPAKKKDEFLHNSFNSNQNTTTALPGEFQEDPGKYSDEKMDPLTGASTLHFLGENLL
jgi:hypothetical protein